MISLPFLVCVTARHGNLRPILIERQARHGRGTLGDTAQFLLVVAVSGEDGAVGSAGGKGSVDGVEGCGVDGVDGVVYVVAFEGVHIFACSFLFAMIIIDSTKYKRGYNTSNANGLFVE